MQITKFDPVIYPRILWVSVGNNLNAIAERFLTPDGCEMLFPEDIWDADAFTTEVMEKETFLKGSIVTFLSKKDITFERVAHECVHFAKDVFEGIGADPRPHEPFEYLVGWAAKCCEEVKRTKIVKKEVDGKPLSGDVDSNPNYVRLPKLKEI